VYTPALKWGKVGGNGTDAEFRAMHIPVLLEETLFWLRSRPGGVYMDCTVGYAGLASRILEQSGPDGILIGIDRDQEALDAAKNNLRQFGQRVYLRKGNFADLKSHLTFFGFSTVDGVVFDFGVSSPQLDSANRGFSFLADGPLDMRMDQSTGRTASDLIHELSEGEIADLIYEFGEERYARRIARVIARERLSRPIETTGQLAALVKQAVPSTYRYGRIHCATRTFQALRIAVNQELDALGSALGQAAEVLAPEGRLCAISFHSLEDRIVKNALRALTQTPRAAFRSLTKKPIMATEAERRRNPRARSAKLRVGERLPGEPVS
jgi:16S rRNA (cytosine1402-N4)-methyltransferase